MSSENIVTETEKTRLRATRKNPAHSQELYVANHHSCASANATRTVTDSLVGCSRLKKLNYPTISICCGVLLTILCLFTVM